jgi:two-component system, OmpR family, response regulator
MRILVVEDEVKIANAVGKALRSEAYAVDVVYDGDAGYSMASTEPYDVIIIDRLIPGEYDGISLIKELRSNKIHTPALMLTALSSIQQKTEGLDAGADDYLTKPFAIDELLARVRALLRRPKVQQQSILQAGKLTLNQNTHEVKWNEETIILTAKESALLEYLLRNKNVALSKEKIINHVWDFDADILPNTVEVYVKYLRQKIDSKYNVKLIKTVRGFGYKIEDK